MGAERRPRLCPRAAAPARPRHVRVRRRAGLLALVEVAATSHCFVWASGRVRICRHRLADGAPCPRVWQDPLGQLHHDHRGTPSLPVGGGGRDGWRDRNVPGSHGRLLGSCTAGGAQDPDRHQRRERRNLQPLGCRADRASPLHRVAMRPLSGRTVRWALLAGAIWGVIGLTLAGQALGPPVWGGVVVAPAIGLAIALAFRGFRARPPGMRVALALVSLYVASGLFALAAGIADALRPIPSRIAYAVVIQTVLGVWWGITFTGLLPLLWPLAYLTHSLLGRTEAVEAAASRR